MFSEAMFHATIEGRKTQTRRIINSKTIEKLDEYWSWRECALSQCTSEISVEADATTSFASYRVGETVYIKEPYSFGLEDETVYKYSSLEIKGYKWENKLFMPAKYARYFIKITGVRCERVQDISDEDCLKEGIKPIPQKYNAAFIYNYGGSDCENTPKRAYAELFDSINGKGTWGSNPYVWVYDYKLIK